MSFYLIGRGRTAGEIRLLSDVLFDDRQTALDELAQMSAAADFAHRDADVFVVDLASAVPVLLVPPPTETSATMPVLEVSVSAEEGLDEAADEEETAGVWEAPAVEAVEEPIADAVIEEAAEQPIPLADALKRAAGTMESEGISAPESVGPATVAAWPWEADEQVVEQDSEDAVPAQAEVGETEDAAEPESQKEFVPSALEEPSIDDEGGLLGKSASEDDTPMPRPVIMGDYAEDEIPPAPPVEDFEELDVVEVVAEEPDVDVPAPPVEEADVVSDVVEVPGVEQDSDLGGILADLETIEEPTTPGPEATMPQGDKPETLDAEDEASSELTCEDCVYVTTCPNKDDLEPSSCGTFQWKSV